MNQSMISGKERNTWIRDEDAPKCYNCNTEFGWIIRRHHCRCCGKIFCHKCSNNNMKIPKELRVDDKGSKKYIIRRDENEKVCDGCKIEIINRKKIRKLIKFFTMLDLDMRDYIKIMRVSKIWYQMGMYFINRITQIQYYLPDHRYQELDRRLLWNNKEYYRGYLTYEINLLKSLKETKMTKKNKDDLIKFLKDRKKKYNFELCKLSSKIDYLKILEILDMASKSKIIQTYIMYYLTQIKSNLFISLIPYIVQKSDLEYIRNYIMEKCRIDNHVALECFYQTSFLYKKTKKEYYHKLSQSILELSKSSIIHKSYDFLLIMSEIVSSNDNLDNIKLKLSSLCNKTLNNKLKLMLPFHKNNFNLSLSLSDHVSNTEICESIIIDEIERKDSANVPIVIPYKTNKGEIKRFLVKKDDLCNDQIILSIIRLIDYILKKEEKLDLDIVTYQAIPLLSDLGLIEIVDDSQTIYTIKERLKFSIQNYIIENNSDSTIHSIRSRFMKSTAAYCVITYLFGIGDRHLSNIMITKNGCLFHIDYGFILGSDPKPLSPQMKLTDEMIDAIGGQNSQYYLDFISLCDKIYNCLRRHTNLFITLLSPLRYSMSDSYIIEQIISRFIPGEQEKQSRLQLYSTIERSYNSARIYDYIHHHKQETLSYLKSFSFFKSVSQ